MIMHDPEKQRILQKNIRLIKMIWYVNIAACAALFFVFQLIEIGETPHKYLQYIFGILAFSEIAVTFVMRRIRLNPKLIKQLDEHGFSAVIRNFRTIELITFILTDSILIYGGVAYLLSGDDTFFKAMALITLAILVFFYPKESGWANHYRNSVGNTQ